MNQTLKRFIIGVALSVIAIMIVDIFSLKSTSYYGVPHFVAGGIYQYFSFKLKQ